MKKIGLALILVSLFTSNAYAFVTGLEFDGIDDYASVNDHPNWTFGTNDFTIELWVNMTNVMANNMIIAQGNSPPQWFLYITTGVAPQGGIWFANWPPPPYGPMGYTMNGAHGMSNNTWHHIALSRRYPTNFSIYVDGVTILDSAIIAPMCNPSGPLNIGINSDGYSHPLSGRLDESRIWNVGMTEAEVQYWMNNQPSGSNQNLLGYWDFDNANLYNLTVPDLSSYGNDAMLHGIPPIPEPSTFLLLGFGLLGAAFRRKRAKR